MIPRIDSAALAAFAAYVTAHPEDAIPVHFPIVGAVRPQGDLSAPALALARQIVQTPATGAPPTVP